VAIDLYYWPTPNGKKISILLEETGLPYQPIPVDITAGAQFDAGFLAISPNNKMPVITDPEGPGGEPISVFESGAILIYLAEKSGQFLPTAARERVQVLEWLMFQMGGVGPMLGQAHHFRQYAPEPIPYAVDRYTNETARLYRVLDTRLAEHEFLAGDYSIADMSVFPWTASYERQGQRLEDYPNLRRWFEMIDARPAVQRGMNLLNELRINAGQLDARARDIMFGQAQWRQGRS
jgi:GST-like protein